MNTSDPNRVTDEQWFSNTLKDHGIDAATAAEHGLRLVSAQEIEALTGHRLIVRCCGILIPYAHQDGYAAVLLRLPQPTRDSDGFFRDIRHIRSKGFWRPYAPLANQRAMSAGTLPVIVEDELVAISLAQVGLPAIAVMDFRAWFEKFRDGHVMNGTAAPLELTVLWASDAALDFRYAVFAAGLQQLCRQTGSDLRVCVLPFTPEGQSQSPAGLLRTGGIEAVRSACQDASSVSEDAETVIANWLKKILQPATDTAEVLLRKLFEANNEETIARICEAMSSVDKELCHVLRNYAISHPRLVTSSMRPEMTHPLSLQDEQSFLLTGIPHREFVKGKQIKVLSPVILDDQGGLYAAKRLGGARDLFDCPLQPPEKMTFSESKLCSLESMYRYRAGHRPDAGLVFGKIVRVFGHFLDLSESVGSPKALRELLALFCIASYFISAFLTAAYLWLTGEAGSGKTSLQIALAKLCCMGRLLVSTTTAACIRVYAASGACLVIDEIEKLKDPAKLALLLSGHRSGSTADIMVRGAPMDYPTFCPKVFGAIARPTDALATRCIVVPMVASLNSTVTQLNAENPEDWPDGCNEAFLRDDLWLLALSHLATVRKFYSLVPVRVGQALVGRTLEPWRSILAVALWLETDHNQAGLFDRMLILAKQLTQAKTEEQPDTLHVQLLRVLVERADQSANLRPIMRVMNQEISDELQRMIQEGGIDLDANEISPRKIGRKIVGLRIGQRMRSSDRTRRGYVIDLEKLVRRARAYEIPIPPGLHSFLERPEPPTQAITAIKAIGSGRPS